MKWNNYECDGQMSIFDFVETEKPKYEAEHIMECEILSGSGFQGGKERIFYFFMNHTEEKERVAFLKKEYGIGGHTIAEGPASHDANGIDVEFKEPIGRCTALHYGWPIVAKKISELIIAGKYYKPKKRTCSATLEECNHDNLIYVAKDLGYDCPGCCCQYCSFLLCGARCNYSVKQHKVLIRGEWVEW